MARAVWMLTQGGTPEAWTMGGIGLLALLANTSVAFMLYAYREGDADMRSVWLCSRNDALGNLAVMLAVAAVMAGLAITSGWTVLHQAMQELKAVRHAAPKS